MLHGSQGMMQLTPWRLMLGYFIASYLQAKMQLQYNRKDVPGLIAVLGSQLSVPLGDARLFVFCQKPRTHWSLTAIWCCKLRLIEATRLLHLPVAQRARDPKFSSDGN